MAYYYSPFRKEYLQRASQDCAFCDLKVNEEQIIRNKAGQPIENEYYRWVINYYPKFEGHTMVVPKRHITEIEQESQSEVQARHDLIVVAAAALKKTYPGAGVEIFMQTGPGSAASVSHLHWHVVPALPDDSLRSFEKMGHFYTTEQEQEKVLLFPVSIRLAREKLQEELAEAL